jgi:hypothetical protein
MTITIATGRAVNLRDYEATSTTSLAVASGARTLTIDTGKAYVAADTVTLEAVGTKLRTRWRGSVTSYNPGTGAAVLAAATQNYEADHPSTTSVLIGTGAKSFVTDPGLTLIAGDLVRVARLGASGVFMAGSVTAYNATTGDLDVNVTTTGGTGTFTDWTIVTDGTFASWVVTPNENEQFDVVGTATLTIDSTPITPVGRFNALTRGQILVRNTSTTTPIVLTFSRLRYGLAVQVTQNGVFDVAGDWISLGTGSGVAGQVFALPAAIDRATLIEVETAAGSGVFKPWHTASSDTTAPNATGSLTRLQASDFSTGSVLGNVMLCDAIAETATSVNAVPLGATVRIPNIHVTQAPFVTYLSADITNVATSATLNYNGATNTTGDLQIGTERLTWSARTGQAYTVARAQRSTTAAAWTKGTPARAIPFLSTGGNQQLPYLDTNSAGTVSLAVCSFHLFYVRGTNFAALSMIDVGTLRQDWSGSAAGMIARRVAISHYSAFQNTYPAGLFAGTLAGDVEIDGLYCNGDTAVAAHTGTTLTSLFNITAFRNVEILFARNAANQSALNFTACAPKVAGATFDDVVVAGGQVAISNSAGIRMLRPRSGASTTGADSTVQLLAYTLVNSSDVDLLNLAKIGGAHRNAIVQTDVNCKSTRVLNAQYDMNGNTGGAFNPAGVDFFAWNCSVGNARALGPTTANNATAKGVFLRNVRGAQVPAYGASQGGTTQTGTIFDFVPARSTFWTTAIGFVPNFKDAGPMFTLIDSAAGTSGRVCVGGFAGEASLDMYDLSGAYLDNGGRLTLETAGDVAVIKSTEPIKGVISFQSAVPLIEQASLVPFTVGAAGSGFVSGTEYAVTGGSGTGGRIRAGATTITTAAVWVAGEGYLAGDVITVPGTTNATITLTAMPTFEFRVATPGNIAGATWADLTAANLAAALGLLSGYDSNVGFDMQVRITANQTVAGASLVNLRLRTVNDGAYAVPESWFTVTNADAGDTIELRRVSDDALLGTRTGTGRLDFIGAPSFGLAGYFIRRNGATVITNTSATPVTLDVLDNGTVSLSAAAFFAFTGPGPSETVEIRKASDDSLVASRSGAGLINLLPASIGLSVYFTRVSGGVTVVTTKTAPVTIAAGDNGTVSLFYGAEVQVAQAAAIDTINALVQARLDVAVSTREAETAAAARAAAELAAIAGIPAALGTVDANVVQVRGQGLKGVGSESDPWGPA